MFDTTSLFYNLENRCENSELPKVTGGTWGSLGRGQGFLTLNHMHIPSTDQRGLKIKRDIGKAKQIESPQIVNGTLKGS